MLDKEKKTIDKLKNGNKYTLVEIIRVFKKEGIENFIITRKEYLDIILNLLEKQANRIKELQAINKKLETRKYMYNAETGEVTAIPIDNNYISKDKIRAKIEEIDIEIQCCEYADDDVEEYKQDMEKEKRRLLRDKAVFQSLLEKE